MMAKEEIRKTVKTLKENMADGEIRNFSRIIIDKLLQTPSYKECQQIFCYVSFNQEVVTKEFIAHAIKDKKKVAVPRIVTDTVKAKKVMKFYLVHSLKELLPGTLGILEPEQKEEVVPERKEKNLFIVPGLAFDELRNRIGYGKGFYDSYFVRYEDSCGEKIGVAYDFQIYKKLPVYESDKKVNQIITPTRIIT